MKPEDIPSFVAALHSICRMLSQGRYTPDEMSTKLFLMALEPFPAAAVMHALHEHAVSSKFPPTPSELVTRLERMDGRPEPEEAWALALQARDEQTTVVWTAEIAEAWDHARKVLEVRDEVGARMVFREVYTRLLGEARRRVEPARWQVALGHDKAGWARAIEAAARQGRVVDSGIATDLPALPDACAPAALLAAPEVSSITPERRAQLNRVRESLKARRSDTAAQAVAKAEADRATDLRAAHSARIVNRADAKLDSAVDRSATSDLSWPIPYRGGASS